MYFVGYSKWLLLGSRLVAGDTHTNSLTSQNIAPEPCCGIDVSFSSPSSGVGAGAGSSIFGFLTRCTRPEERAGIFAAVMACRQAGLLVGQSPECLCFFARTASAGEKDFLILDARLWMRKAEKQKWRKASFI